MNRFFPRFVFIICCLLSSLSTLASDTDKPVLRLWSYYDSPPFVTSENSNTGLIKDLVDYLNTKLGDKYRFQVEYLPRYQLNYLFEKGDKGIVLLAPSIIFGGLDSGHYLWSDAILHDEQKILSRQDKQFEYQGPLSLKGIRFAGVRGHSYPAIDAQIASGDIQCFRAADETLLFNALFAERGIDVITLADSSARYLIKLHPETRAKMYYSRLGLGEFTRHLLFQAGMQQERDLFNQVIQGMNQDPVWQAILAKYGLD